MLRGRDPERGRLLLAPAAGTAAARFGTRGARGTRASVRSSARRGSHEVYRTTICLAEARSSPRFEELTLGLSPALFGATLLVGIGGGAIGAAYLLAIHLLQHVLAPQHFGAAAAVRRARRGRRGRRGHRARARQPRRRRAAGRQHSRVGWRDRAFARSVRSSRCRSSRSPPVAPPGPRRRSSRRAARSPSWLARVRRSNADRDALPDDRGHGGRVRGAVRRADRRRVLRVGDPAPTRHAVPRSARCPRSSARSPGSRARWCSPEPGVKPVWTIPPVDVGARRSTSSGRSVPASAARCVAIVFTYLVLGLRRVFALGPRLVRPVVGGLALALLALWSPYTLTFGEQQTALRSPAPARGERARRGASWRSCSARRSRFRRAGPAGSSSRCSSWARRSASSRITASSTPGPASSSPRSWPRPTWASRRRCSARRSSSPRWAACGCCPPRCSPRSSR